MPFTVLGLCDQLVRGILATGYSAPTQIQSEAIPAAVAGEDIIGCAQTGTGKTAAFVLPILNRLGHEKGGGKKRVRALIVTPTRELAVQIEEAIREYGRFTHFRALAVYGGVDIKKQFNALNKGVDIVVATPGRLIDHMKRESIDLRHVEVLVLDEADRMFDMGFIKDVERIIKALPKERQTMLFSATMSKEVKALAGGVMKNPKVITIGQMQNPVDTITQRFFAAEKEKKTDMLLHMLESQHMYSVLVFSRTKHGADKITRRLERAGIKTVAIHSGRTQSQRQRALDGFKRGQYQVMVATDIAARGIDVEGISHVINYDVPVYAEDYIHRIGRTGRATAKGDAITFVCRDEGKYLTQIEKFISRYFEVEDCPGYSYSKPKAAIAPARQKTKPPVEKPAAAAGGKKSPPNWPKRRRRTGGRR